MNTPIVLLYNLEPSKEKEVKMLCLLLKVRTKSVRKDEYSELLAALTGMETAAGEPYTGEGFQEEMMVMAGLSAAQMNSLLQGFKRKKITPICLKAVATPVNLQWDSLRLHDELKREHEAMLRGETAHKG